jgi:RsiW-degrading membrane proteinase PrsW (M82 family)
MLFTPEAITFALAFGFCPPLVWLFFWLREDVLHPEPRSAIALTFFTGMCMVLMVIPIQQAVESLHLNDMFKFTVWAYIEEIAKFLAVYFTVLTKKVVDEPIDPLIYMITAALGFSALENTFFLLNPSAGLEHAQVIATGMFRFIGANVLHTVCSAVVGASLGLSFYMHGFAHRVYVVGGVILAGLLHTLFNVFILSSSGAGVLLVFVYVWGGAIGVLLLCEYVKRVVRTNEQPS